MDSFFASMTPWPRNDGSLHVYALPDEALRDRLETVSVLLDDVAGLPRMPLSWLHFTVSRLAQFDDIGQAGLTALCDALTRELAGLSPVAVELGVPAPGPVGVTVEAPASPGWDALVAAVRRAAAAVSDDPLPPAPHGPHVSLAYATAPVDDAVVVERLAGATPVGGFTITGLHLVSVTVRPELGTFDWTELASWDLPVG